MACIPGVVGLRLHTGGLSLSSFRSTGSGKRIKKLLYFGGCTECRSGTSSISGAGADWRQLLVGRPEREQVALLKDEVLRAQDQARLSEARLQQALQQLSEMQKVVDTLAQERADVGGSSVLSTSLALPPAATSSPPASPASAAKAPLNVSGRCKPYADGLKNHWYPVLFSKDLDKTTLVPIESFEEPWVLFRGADGKPGCLRDECAHRACPLSLGTVTKEGCVQCPYHGWEFATDGNCRKIPSTVARNAKVRVLPCTEQDGMIWIWPGSGQPFETLPDLRPPSGYTIHAQILLELPVEHGLLVENLLDLAHAPFTHTSTFAKGWSVPDMVRFKAVEMTLQGAWDPYPIDMAFQPPCMVLSTIGLAKPGKLEGSSAAACKTHLHQLHVCMPSSRGKTRLLYRMALDFAAWAKDIPFIDRLWLYLANQVLAEDLRLVEGQQDRMHRGANVWNNPVNYDKLGMRYRRWRNAVEAGESSPFT